MRKRMLCCWLGAALVVGVGSPVLAEDRGDATPSVRDAELERLRVLLEQQQQQIDQLRSQVASADSQDMDRQRVEEMKRQIREILSEQEFRESLMPSITQAGYDDGFYIRSSDDQFLVKFNGWMQFRWTHYATREGNRYLNPGLRRNDRTGFDMQRIRLQASGHLYTDDLTWLVHLRADAPDQYDAVVDAAWINYRFMDELQFRAGLMRLASTRNSFEISEAKQNFVDGPMTDAVFGLNDGLGVRLWGQLFGKRLEYFLDVVNSVNSDTNRTITPDPAEHDNNPAILFRVVWHAINDDPPGGFSSGGDVDYSDSPKLDFGFHYAFNDDQGDVGTTRIPFPLRRNFRQGGFGLTTTNGLQIHQFGFDTAFKWRGFSIYGEYDLRIVDVRRAGRTPFSPWWVLTGDDSTVVQHGGYLAAGYFLPIPGLERKLEIAGRVGGISTLAHESEGVWEWAVGANYYIKGNNVKLQADIGQVSEAPITSSYSTLANVNDDALIFRVQLQVAF